MALGDRAAARIAHMQLFGRHVAIGTTPILVGGGVVTSDWRAAAAAATNVISSDDADNGGTATGALTVRVTGMDGDFHAAQETVTLNGTTQVALTTQFLRVWRAEVLTAGSGGSNAGVIDVRHTTTVLAKVAIGDNQSQLAAVSVPAGHIGSVDGIYCEIEKAGGATTFITYKLWTQKSGEAKRLRYVSSPASGGDTRTVQTYTPSDERSQEAIEVVPGEDIWVEGDASAADQTGNAGLDIHFTHRGVGSA